jgi:hypothetical protein
MPDVKYRITAEDKTRNATQSASQNLEGVGKSAMDLKKVFLGAAAGIFAVMKASEKLIGAYGKQLDAETKLRNAIRATGKVTEISFGRFKELATAYQDVTRFGDELTLSALGTVQSFADLNQKGLEKLLPNFLDFGEYLGNAETAASLIGKTLGSSTNALARYGIEIDMTGTKEQKLQQLTEQLQKKFGGLAQEMGQNSIGAMKRFQNNIGDVFESIGGAIAESLTGPLNSINRWFTENRGRIANFFKYLPEIAGLTFDLIKKMIQRTFSFDTVKALFAAWGKGLLEVFRIAISSIPMMFLNALHIMAMPILHFGGWLLSVFQKIFAELGNFFIDVLNKLPFVDIKKAAVPEIKEIGQVWNDMTNEIKDKIGNQAKLAGDALNQVGNNLKNVGSDIKSIYDKELTDFSNKINEIVNRTEDLADSFKNVSNNIPDIAQKYSGMGTSIGTGNKPLSSGVKTALAAAVGSMAGPWGTVISVAIQKIGELIENFDSFNEVMDFSTTIFKALGEAISPTMESLFKPLANYLKILGTTLGKVIVPVLELMRPALEAVAGALIWFHNKVIVPIGNFIIFIFNSVYNFVAGIWNGIASAINALLGWAGVHLGMMATRNANEGSLSTIDSTDIQNSDSSGGGGGTAQYTAGKEINVTVNIYTDVIAGEGGVRDLAIMIRNEILEAEALGL